MPGEKQGRWTILDKYEITDSGDRKWLCRDVTSALPVNDMEERVHEFPMKAEEAYKRQTSIMHLK